MKKNIIQILLTEQFTKFIQASISGRRLANTDKRVSKGTINNYHFTQKLLMQFEQTFGIQLRILLQHKSSFRILQQEKNYWTKFKQKFLLFH